MLKGKKIFLAIPDNNGLHELFVSQLTTLGANVTISLIKTSVGFKYSNIWQRIYNAYRKIIRNDFDHKQELIRQYRQRLMMDELPKITEFDYTLCVRPDMFPISLLRMIRDRSKIMTAYQWDGFARNPVNKHLIALFDRFFVFDPSDVQNGCLPITNFHESKRWPDFEIVSQYTEVKKAFLIVGYDSVRFQYITRLKHDLVSSGLHCQFIVVSPSSSERKKILRNGLQYASSIIPYTEALETVKKADVLIDIVSPVHKGLSYRVFEALGYGKKLITTNDEVKKYDFYYPENIFIWEEGNQEELKAFLETPMREVPKHIWYKYHFDNWIKYVFNIEEYQPILLSDS